MGKSSTNYEGQGDWSDYEESDEVIIHLCDSHNESNESRMLPKKRKHTRRQISDNSESSRLTDTSSKEWIWKKIDHVAEIKKNYRNSCCKPFYYAKSRN